jgi:guanylate kinase
MVLTNNKIIILTAPSGAGKTSITKYLLNKHPELTFSVSATTRLRRKYETDGKDYYFISIDQFNQKIKQDEFVEWEMVYEGKYYGTLKAELKRIWDNLHFPVLDIDVKGAIHVQQQYPASTLSIFIEPPSIDALQKRLEARGTETPETLLARLSKAAYEISFKHQFSKIIINDNLDRACAEAERFVIDWLA